LRLQVTTRSVLGAVAYETGGILVDAGRIRLFGAGSERSLLTVNEAIDGFGDVVFVANDVLGGIFALNGARFGPADLGQIFHLAADSVAWSCLDIGYADFVAWCLTGDRDALYDRFARLPAFREPAPAISMAWSFYPFLWTKEAGAAPPAARVVPADEVMRLRIEFSGFEIESDGP
jgi:hypothetical protein